MQCRAGDTQVLALLAAIDNKADRMATRAERTFLSALGGGCSTPIAAYARVGDDAMIEMNAMIVSLDGQMVIRVQGVGTDAQQLGRELAKEALGQGAQEMLAHA